MKVNYWVPKFTVVSTKDILTILIMTMFIEGASALDELGKLNIKCEVLINWITVVLQIIALCSLYSIIVIDYRHGRRRQMTRL